MRNLQLIALCGLMLPVLTCPGHAESIRNVSFEGKYKTTAHVCVASKCDDQAEDVSSAFYIGTSNAHVYAGTNKGLIVPFGQRSTSTDGKSVWIVPTPVGFDETYSRDGFTIKHSYAINPDATCSISVSVLKQPAEIQTAYKTEMQSCKVAQGNLFSSK